MKKPTIGQCPNKEFSIAVEGEIGTWQLTMRMHFESDGHSSFLHVIIDGISDIILRSLHISFQSAIKTNLQAKCNCYFEESGIKGQRVC